VADEAPGMLGHEGPRPPLQEILRRGDIMPWSQRRLIQTSLILTKTKTITKKIENV